ncbi:hypothetical protein CDL15_Pgr019788 [Punica granatum]|uniref:Uncharacterized protein n=1 Tax=Punica granatum TaxID=22663 RepID=A0A218X6X3_PUNGR|nr:hypothetical protein CDL15_Pgr019788 [Punica granatum]
MSTKCPASKTGTRRIPKKNNTRRSASLSTQRDEKTDEDNVTISSNLPKNRGTFPFWEISAHPPRTTQTAESPDSAIKSFDKQLCENPTFRNAKEPYIPMQPTKNGKPVDTQNDEGEGRSGKYLQMGSKRAVADRGRLRLKKSTFWQGVAGASTIEAGGAGEEFTCWRRSRQCFDFRDEGAICRNTILLMKTTLDLGFDLNTAAGCLSPASCRLELTPNCAKSMDDFSDDGSFEKEEKMRFLGVTIK